MATLDRRSETASRRLFGANTRHAHAPCFGPAQAAPASIPIAAVRVARGSVQSGFYEAAAVAQTPTSHTAIRMIRMGAG